MSSSQYGMSGAFAAESSAPSRAQDTRTIERRLGEFVTAWNKHDPAQMVAMWHDDGDLINPWGRIAKGRDQVQDLFRDEHTGPMKMCSHQMAIASVRLAADDVAIVDADCTLTGLRDPDGKELPVFKPHVVFVMSKKDGDWKILSARPYAFTPRPETAR